MATVGQILPQLEIPLSRTLIVSTAIASRDYQDVHHDPDLAKEKGSKDVFMNILTTNGLVGRYITDWAGPKSRLKKISLRLGVPNYPDDTMTMSGEVTEINGDIATVTVIGKNSLGPHVTATVLVDVKECEV